MAKNAESQFNEEEIAEVGVETYAAKKETLNKLPAPLTVMTFDETIDYLRYLIVQEHTELGLPGKQPQYGKPAWRPVNCWKNDVWDWSDVG